MLLLPALGVEAQTAQSRELVERWIERQRGSLEALESLTVRTTVRHAVETSVSTRVATYAADLTLHLPDEPPGPPAGGRFVPPLRRRGAGAGNGPGGPGPPGPDVDMRLLWMTLDGDTLETDYARRIFQRLRNMLQPETTRMLDDIGIPAAHIARLDPTGAPKSDRIAGRSALRIDTRPPGPHARRLTVSLWFDERGERLIATRLVLQFPGDRRLTAFTEYDEIGGLDLPVRRTVDGVVPVPRRGRNVSLALDHRTHFTDYEFRFKDG